MYIYIYINIYHLVYASRPQPDGFEGPALNHDAVDDREVAGGRLEGDELELGGTWRHGLKKGMRWNRVNHRRLGVRVTRGTSSCVLYTAASHKPTLQQGWGNYKELLETYRPLDSQTVYIQRGNERTRIGN